MKAMRDFLQRPKNEIFQQIESSLKTLGISFDKFSNEKTYYESGAIKDLLEELKEKNLIYDKDGATWYKATATGGQQDKVYIKSTESPPTVCQIPHITKIRSIEDST